MLDITLWCRDFLRLANTLRVFVALGNSRVSGKSIKHSTWVVGLLLGTGISMGLAGCAAGPRSELPVPIQYSIAAAVLVNPSPSGRASPVVLHVYELRNTARFVGADYFSLANDDRTALGDEFVSRQEYVLMPGESRLVRRRADLSTRFVGVVASYRDIENSVWRTVVPVPAPHQGGLLTAKGLSPERRLLITADRGGLTVLDETGQEGARNP